MAIFCTKCGTSNEDGAGFCDNCGAPLRAALAKMPDIDVTGQPSTAAGSTVQPRPVTNINPKKIIYAAAGLAIVLIVGGGAMYFILQPPAATASTLLAAAKAGYGKETTDRFKGELCITNIDYRKNTFNARENDQGTLTWMNALVSAGLYNPPVAMNSGGYFPQTLLQYVATPELEKYRDGSRLCVAKDIEITDVIDIEKPEEQSIGPNGTLPKVMAVKTILIFKSINTAPWMEKPDVRDAVFANISGWDYKDKAFQKKVADSFGLREGKWATGVAYKSELNKQYLLAQRNNNNAGDNANKNSGKNASATFSSSLAELFRTKHPLEGTWRSASMMNPKGVTLPAGSLPEIKFTSNTMEEGSESIEADFSVDGNNVRVTVLDPSKGETTSTIFIMDGSNKMSFKNQTLGITLRYERVK